MDALIEIWLVRQGSDRICKVKVLEVSGYMSVLWLKYCISS